MSKEKFESAHIKISPETSKAVKEVAEELSLLLEETSDEFIVTENKGEGERKIHFTKIGNKVPVGEGMYPYEDFFKAAMQAPGDIKKQKEILQQLAFEREKRKTEGKK